MYRFLLSPKWILSHVFVLLLIVTMVNLGLWQLRRLDEKQVRNEQILERGSGEADPYFDVIAPDASADIADEEDYRNLQVTGVYDTANEFIVINRSQDGLAGRWLVTPLQPTGGGPVVLILRGFLSQAAQDITPPIEGFEPPEGEVTVAGWARPGREGEGFQSKNSLLDTGEWTRVDIDQYAEATDIAVAPMYLQMYEQEPSGEPNGLMMIPLPDLDDGPHLAYAGQWLIFTLIALGGYPLILRKVTRERAGKRG